MSSTRTTCVSRITRVPACVLAHDQTFKQTNQISYTPPVDQKLISRMAIELLWSTHITTTT